MTKKNITIEIGWDIIGSIILILKVLSLEFFCEMFTLIYWDQNDHNFNVLNAKL